MELFGKCKMTYVIEYTIKDEGYVETEKGENFTYSVHPNKKHLKAAKKGKTLTRKYLAKMQKLGFEVALPEEANEDNTDT